MQWASSITKSPIRILRRCSCTSAVNSVSVATNTREALIKSARADSERFCFLRKFGELRNTLCISDFPNCTGGAKDPLLSRRRFIQRFPRSSLPVSRARRMSPRRSFVRRLSTAQAQFFRCLQLVLHQHKQRTDDHGHAPVLLPHQFCAGKIHQTFSPAGSLHHQGSSPGRHRLNRFVLPVTECRFRAVQPADYGQCLFIKIPVPYARYTETSLQHSHALPDSPLFPVSDSISYG